ncbi:MAG: HEAT repeat domain-containing protein [Candidatus Aminicenantes bacterium]|nr:MAG: HEAT repeat domain-containing protein [Candidatus Aminicenantes bacterium]
MEQDEFDNRGSPGEPEAKPAPEEPAQEKPEEEKSTPEEPAPQRSTPEKSTPEKFAAARPSPEKKIDPAELNKVKLIFKYFDTAFSTLKLYPPGNPSIAKSVGIFYEKLREFLDKYKEFRIGIKEFDFTYKDEIAFQDEEKKRSLPFFLFKDGMRELTFYKGLEDKELQYFLDTLKEAIDLPPEESDAVGLLWEKDFINVRYYAIDEFLDLNIGGGEKSLDFEIDSQKLSEGKLDMKSEDYAEAKEKSDMLVFGPQDEEEKEEGEGDLEGSEESDSRIPTIKKEQLPEIEKMIAQDKQVSASAELVALLFEILYYEENLDRFSDVLKILEKYFHDIVDIADFPQALTAVQNIHELKETLREKSPDKFSLLDKVMKNATDERFMSLLKKLYLEEKVKDHDSFFDYLEFLGPGAISVVGMVWENPKGPAHKQRALDILREAGKKDIGALMYMAKGSNVALTLEVIALLETVSDLKDLHFLKDFIQHPNIDIRMEIVRILGVAGNEQANEILIQFLIDEDVEVRAFAAENLKYVGDEETFDFVMDLAADKEFRKRTKVEKKFLLSFLASAQKEEVYKLFRSILKKWKLFSAHSHNETRMAAVAALEEAATPEARQVLEEGTSVFGRTIREACRLALSRMASGEKPPPKEKPPSGEKPPTGEKPASAEEQPKDETPPSDEKPLPSEEPPPDEKLPPGEKPPSDEESSKSEQPPSDEKPPSDEEPSAGEKPSSSEELPPDEKPPPDEKSSLDEKPPSGEEPASEEEPPSGK